MIVRVHWEQSFNHEVRPRHQLPPFASPMLRNEYTAPATFSNNARLQCKIKSFKAVDTPELCYHLAISSRSEDRDVPVVDLQVSGSRIAFCAL